MSLSVFPREPAASLDATVDYVKVGTTNVHVHLHITGKLAELWVALQLVKLQTRPALWWF